MSDKKKCNKKCINCRYFKDITIYGPYNTTPNYICTKDKTETTDCVTGDTKIEYADPYEKNSNGCCNDWEEKVSVSITKTLEQLIDELHKDEEYKPYNLLALILAKLLRDELDENISESQGLTAARKLLTYVQRYYLDEDDYSVNNDIAYGVISDIIKYLQNFDNIPDYWRKRK